MKKTHMLGILLALTACLTVGCAKQRNRWAANGGFFASMTGGVNGDHVVISQSGGEIMDVWKLKNSIVQSPEGSDGWLFRDNDGNPVNIGGDVKVIRIVGGSGVNLWDKDHEYHMEFESQTYREKFNVERE